MQQNYNKKTTQTGHKTIVGTLLTLLYRIYVLFVFLPLFLVASIITATVTAIGCRLGNGHFWGYHPGRLWGKFTIRALLLPVKVEGRGSFDIFLIYGFLGRNFKWMMKKSIRKIPFIGIACEYAHHIFVDKSGASKIKRTYDQARETLREGMSVVVFPEGARTFTGHLGVFRRGAFMLADDLQLPVVPLTINGSFDVKPRTKDLYWAFWHPLKLTIHEPIMPIGRGPENIKNQMEQSYQAVMNGLDKEYQGFVENPDQ